METLAGREKVAGALASISTVFKPRKQQYAVQLACLPVFLRLFHNTYSTSNKTGVHPEELFIDVTF